MGEFGGTIEYFFSPQISQMSADGGEEEYVILELNYLRTSVKSAAKA
jgi:hypothetical protein